MNRKTSVTYPDLSTVSYLYDAVGNLLSVIDSVGTTTYTYDVLNRIASVTDPFGNLLQYQNDSNGNQTVITYPGSKDVTYSYDEINRLSQVVDWDGVTTSYTYDNAGRLVEEINGNNSSVTYSYNTANQLLDMKNYDPFGAIISEYSYVLDANGNKVQESVVQPLSLQAVTPQNITLQYNTLNQLTSVDGITYAFDARGNQTQRDDSGVLSVYSYDYADRLISIDGNTGLHTFEYNTDGDRLLADNNTVVTRYLIDKTKSPSTVLADMAQGNSVQKYYVYGHGLLYSIDGTTSERLYYHYDPVGSTVATSDASGNLVDKYAYMPFGKLNNSVETSGNRFTYVGKHGVAIEKSGLYFMRARYYDPDTRRFLSEDPVIRRMASSQADNRYVYVDNNPLSFIDPDGEKLEETHKNLDYIENEATGACGSLSAADAEAMGCNYIKPLMNLVRFTTDLLETVGDIFSIGNPVSYVAEHIAVRGSDMIINDTGKSLPHSPVRSSSGASSSGSNRAITSSDYANYSSKHHEFLKSSGVGSHTFSLADYIKWRKDEAAAAISRARYQVGRKKIKNLIDAFVKEWENNNSSKYSHLVLDLKTGPDFNNGNLNRLGSFSSK